MVRRSAFTNGKEDFDKLWNGSREAVLWAFHILELNSVDLCQEPLLKRKIKHRKVLSSKIEFVDHIEAMGPISSNMPAAWDSKALSETC